MIQKVMIPGDWVIREGPEIKVGDFGAYSGEMMPHPLLVEIGARELQNSLAFTSHAVFVLDVTDTHVAVFDPFVGQPVIAQLSYFPGSWKLATKTQVEVTWTLAKKMLRQEMIPLLEAVMSKYPYRDRWQRPAAQ